MIDLTGTVALVSGGSGGLGLAHAEVFAELGASVVIGDVNDGPGRELAAKLAPQVTYVHLDVTSAQSWADAVASAVDSYGGLDLLVNNAGICPINPIDDTTAEDFTRTMQVNLLGTFLGVQAGGRAIRSGGTIVNIGSIDGMRGVPNMIAYCATKAGTRTITRTAALELAPRGIRVVGIHPGAVDTPMMHNDGNRLLELAGVPEEQRDIDAMLRQVVPLGRVADPREVAQWSAFLASAPSAYATGSEYVLDGGLVAGSASL